MLLGADHAHVFVGLLFNVWLLWKLARGLTTYRANAVQAIAWYWQFVNVLTSGRRPDPVSAARMSVRRLAVLQWVGLLLGA